MPFVPEKVCYVSRFGMKQERGAREGGADRITPLHPHPPTPLLYECREIIKWESRCEANPPGMVTPHLCSSREETPGEGRREGGGGGWEGEEDDRG